MCEPYLQALQLSDVLINWTTIKSIHWYLLVEVEVNGKNCSPLGRWWLTYKSWLPFLNITTLPSGCAILLSLGLYSSSVWDSSPWAASSHFWSSFLMLGQDCSKLPEHSTLFPEKWRETLPGFSPLCSGGDPARCLIHKQSAQLHWLTEKVAQKFEEEYTQRNRWDLELDRIILSLAIDLSSSSESSFQLATHALWLQCLPVHHRPASLGQPARALHRNTR